MSIDPFDFSREGFEKRQSIVEAAAYRSRKEGLEAEQARRDETTRLGAVRKRPLGQGVTKFEKWDGTQWIEISQREYEIYETPLTSRKAAVERAQALYENTKDDDKQDTEPPEVVKKLERNTYKGKSSFSGLGKFQPLRYPKERTDNNQDYIQFSVVSYERNGMKGGPVGSNFKVDRPDVSLLNNLLGSITLPIPSQIGDNNSVNYAGGQMNFLTEQLLGVAGSGISGNVGEAFDRLEQMGLDFANDPQKRENVKQFFAQQAIQSLGLNISIDQLLVRSSGAIINPNMELLFTSPNLRTFAFAFKFTPRFREEGEEVKQIIRTFKKYSSPKGGAGDYLKSPDVFQIRYLGKNGGNHKFLNRFKLCALTQMSVNYTADGVYATYDNETPVSMIMTLNFQELTPIYAEDYDDTLGVGY